MKHTTLKLAVLGAFGLASAQVLATGFVNLPATGFAVGSDTSAYTPCNTSGDFGSGIATKPTTGANNTCAVFPTPIEISPPESGFSFIASASRPVKMDNTYTGGVEKTVGTVTEYVWRKQTGSDYECIYGAKVVMSNTDYHTATGNQYFEVNDLARGGFSGLPVEVAYSTKPAVAEVVYRIGRTYTSVQHRGTGYTAQPLTGLGSSPSINGLNSYPGTAGASQQLADLDDNWVDFTMDVNFLDDDGSTVAASGLTYVKTTCNSDAPGDHEADDAIRLRQTFQELSGDGVTDNPFIEVVVKGYVPPGGTITPAHTDPY